MFTPKMAQMKGIGLSKHKGFVHECFIPEQGFQPEGSLADRPCGKNPGHKLFISINELQLSQLPNDWMKEDVYTFFKTCARLTVRIRPTYVSSQRPDMLLLGPSMKQGKKMGWFGTGWVARKPDIQYPCNCGECAPDTLGYRILISTACHVICDTEEAAKAKVDFYADDPNDNSKIISLTGFKVLGSSVDGDWCRFVCITHDKSFFRTVDADFDLMCQQSDSIREASGNKALPYHFIISHPHGFPKQISFGDDYKTASSEGNTYFQYNTPTCAGSSGAQIFDEMSLKFFYGFFNSSHHGTDGYNKSCTYPSSLPHMPRFM